MKHPTKQECFRLLEEYQTPEHVKRHCRAVALTACTIAGALNEKGYALNLDLILAAGLLHDIARVEDKHWEVGADFLLSLGYQQESDIVRVHMTYSPFSPVEKITETDMVCLGDRLVMEDQYVGLDVRIQYVIDKMKRKHHEDAIPHVLEKSEETSRFIRDLEGVLGKTIEELMATAGAKDRQQYE